VISSFKNSSAPAKEDNPKTTMLVSLKVILTISYIAITPSANVVNLK